MFAKTESRKPWFFVPTLYFAEGLPYILVNVLAVAIYKKMGVPNKYIAFWTSWLYLPWAIKMFWGPLVDIYSTKRNWILSSQAVLAVLILAAAISLNAPQFLALSMAAFLLIAFASATQDIAVDGYYMLSMNEKEQAFFVGIRAFFYRLAMLFASGALVYLAGRIETKTGNIPLSWTTVLFILSGIFALLLIYHRAFLPCPAADFPDESKVSQFAEFRDAFIAYFKQDKILISILFILLYRFGEAMLVKLAAPFLLDPASVGGAGLTTGQYGLAYGTIGLICLISGGIIGGWLISKYGLKKCIWPMALALNAPDIVYVYMAYVHPPVYWVGILVAIEQLGFGLGTTAFMYYLIQMTGEKYKTSHFAISTGIMAFGMMLPGFASGFLQEKTGYAAFFIIVCLATIPGMALIPFLNIKQKTT